MNPDQTVPKNMSEIFHGHGYIVEIGVKHFTINQGKCPIHLYTKGYELDLVPMHTCTFI